MLRGVRLLRRSPTQVYHELVASGKIQYDHAQVAALPQVERLYTEFEAYQARPNQPPRQVELRPPNRLGVVPSFFLRREQEEKLRRALHSSPSSGAAADELGDTAFHPLSNVRGLYMYGGVGCGKTFLMDLLYQEVSTRNKQRIHFHQFLLDVQRLMHTIKTELKRTEMAEVNLFDEVAQRMLTHTELLCFDEVAVADVADAMIMRRLFTSFYKLGVVVVYTSNRHPSELYKGGLNRESFVPFIRLVENRCVVFDMASTVDHRLSGSDAKTYLCPFSPENEARFNQQFLDVCKGLPTKQVRLPVFGRDVVIPRAFMGATGGVCLFDFHEVCGEELSSADFEVIAKTFHTVFIRGVSRFPYDMNDAKHRFLLLIDTLYEYRCKLVVYAEVEPALLERTEAEEREALQLARERAEQYQLPRSPSSLPDAELRVRHRSALTEFERETGKQLIDAGDSSFQMQRCVSRLVEMRSAEYLQLPHKFAEVNLETE